jgi:hypothetical protein
LGVSAAISVRGTGRQVRRVGRLEAHLLQLDRRRREHQAVGHRLRLLALGDAVDGKPLVRRLRTPKIPRPLEMTIATARISAIWRRVVSASPSWMKRSSGSALPLFHSAWNSEARS